MALEASICSKCGGRGLAPVGSDKCFCGGDMIVFNVTEDQYIKMSETGIQQMIEQMGIKPQISKDDALVIYDATKSVEIVDAMIELKINKFFLYFLHLI